MNEIKLSSIISPHFKCVHKEIKCHRYTHFMLGGGRGSTKSSFLGIETVLSIIRNPTAHALVMRKVAGTLKDSVYAQICWAIDGLGLSGEFNFKVSPLEITYKCTGQKIYFRGADDPIKIKSIKPRFGYIGIAWFEELDQFHGMEEIRSINQSIMRGGEKFWIFYSFNPPKSRDNWVNVERLTERADRLINHSTYLDVPHGWLGEQFISEAEILKEKNYNAYAHEYLGESTGTGGAIFENITERKITEEELNNFDRVYCGADFGFAVDPFAFVRLHYDRKRETLYVIDEIYMQKLKNTAAVELIKKYGANIVTADSAEPKSIAEFNDLGLKTIGAKKGPDSVEYGIRFLQNLREIVVDKNRTPNTYKELVLYEYEQNKQGEYISAYPDKNNHAIDAIRYALNGEIMNNKIKVLDRRKMGIY